MDLVHMNASALFIFSLLKILKPHTVMFSKIIALNMWIDMFMRSVCKKVSVKNTLNFVKYKIKNSNKRIHYCNTILLPFII
jgi:hypothetical protein